MGVDGAKGPSGPQSLAQIVPKAEAFTKDVMKDWDSSHDWWHADRVRKLAKDLAVEEGLQQHSLELVELAALLHDVGDHKYASRQSAGPASITNFLQSNGCTDADTDVITTIIDRMGFKEELDQKRASYDLTPELAVVQDADRLDAIGAVGIARCLTFGGSRGRVLHDPSRAHREQLSKEEYQHGSEEATTIHHFYEKLLKLKGMMKTQAGKRRAEARHQYMVDFLERLYREWDGVL